MVAAGRRPAATLAAVGETGAGASERIRVLVADDDDDVRGLLGEYFRSEPFELVGAAADAGQALALAREHRPHAALVDVDMPGGGAQRVVDELGASTAIVILSGLEEDNLVRGLIQAGAIAYLVKGAPRDEIVDAVRRAVDARERLSDD
jgi:DNA-binding NarL/FixJ family response regulator